MLFAICNVPITLVQKHYGGNILLFPIVVYKRWLFLDNYCTVLHVRQSRTLSMRLNLLQMPNLNCFWYKYPLLEPFSMYHSAYQQCIVKPLSYAMPSIDYGAEFEYRLSLSQWETALQSNAISQTQWHDAKWQLDREESEPAKALHGIHK